MKSFSSFSGITFCNGNWYLKQYSTNRNPQIAEIRYDMADNTYSELISKLL